jgi:hypothetical protein
VVLQRTDLPVAPLGDNAVAQRGRAPHEPARLVVQDRRLVPRRCGDDALGVVDEHHVPQRERGQQRRLAVLLRQQHERLAHTVEVVGKHAQLERFQHHRVPVFEHELLAEPRERV